MLEGVLIGIEGLTQQQIKDALCAVIDQNLSGPRPIKSLTT
jgi:hypothetical protein